ncbi:MAG: DUF3108 domain-containing protein [Elusimicrobiaceae bacterium]|nr:DUF3108 domain-containing protein [Elusimicrobiaceae bacterium]
MKKFLLIIFCFTFICACKTSQKQQSEQEVAVTQKQEIAAEVTEEKPEVKEIKKEPKQEVKTVKQSTKTEVKQTNKEVAKQEIKQPLKEEVKQEVKPVQSAEIKTTEVRLDNKNLPKEILKTDDGRLTHPWYFMKVSTFTPEGKAPLWFGEELNYKISWAFVTAGEATIKADKLLYNGEDYAYQIETLAKSYPVIDKMFKVRDINMSWIKSDLSKSLGYWQSVREGSYKRDEWLNFDYKNNLYSMYKQNKKGELYKYTTPFTGTEVFDVLSALYYVRNPKISLNKTIYFDIVNVNKQYPLKVIIHGKETIKTKAGKFNCIVVEPMISGESIFVVKGKSLKVWLTDDEYRLPVKLEVEVFIGSVKAELYSYKKGGNL